jgi:UDP-sulfoquinovose synthase
MRIIVLGGNGYLGWPMSMNLSKQGHKIYIVDNLSKEEIIKNCGVVSLNKVYSINEKIQKWNNNYNNKIEFFENDLLDFDFLSNLLEKIKPDTIIHFAEQPSAPYSMMNRDAAVFTQQNNIIGTLNLLFAIKEKSKDSHLIKLGSMGEYGTPNIDIEEGWIEINHKNRKEKVFFPKKPNSIYHLSKVHDSYNINFASRMWGLKITDLNQGVVYGLDTPETKLDEYFTTPFYYDHIFGTVINRMILQAAMNDDLTVYGSGKHKRTFININNTIECINLAINNPPKNEKFEVYNQFTEVFSILEIASNIFNAAKDLNLNPKIKFIKNPRIEDDEHYYNPINKKFINLGLKKIKFDDKLIKDFIIRIQNYKDNANKDIILPNIFWK